MNDNERMRADVERLSTTQTILSAIESAKAPVKARKAESNCVRQDRAKADY